MFLLVLFLPLLLGFFSQHMERRVSAESLQMMEQAVTRAAIECYALEGFYPPSVDYLSDHYGVAIDQEQYFVDYVFIGSNLMPEIMVLPIVGGESDHG